MKLNTTLPESVGFLHAVPLFNLFALLVLFLSLGDRLEEKKGVSVTLPSSFFQVDRYEEAAVITLTSDGLKQMYWGTQSVNFDKLNELLDDQVTKGFTANSAIVIRADKNVSSELMRQVAEISVKKGFRVVLAADGASATSKISGNE
jgi:biopolymer transport protein ExbD